MNFEIRRTLEHGDIASFLISYSVSWISKECGSDTIRKEAHELLDKQMDKMFKRDDVKATLW